MSETPVVAFEHRAGNDPTRLEALRRLPLATVGGRGVLAGVEGDLKWLGERFYLFHGPTGLERLGSVAAIDRERRGGRAAWLEELAEAGVPVLLELKHVPDAPDHLGQTLDRLDLASRARLAGSSMACLDAVRGLGLPLVLFSPGLARGRALHLPRVGVGRALRHGVTVPASSVHRIANTNVLSADRSSTLQRWAGALGARWMPGAFRRPATLERVVALGADEVFPYGPLEVMVGGAS